MDTVSRALLDGCREDLKIALRQTETGVFRGGQRPLAGGVANIPAVVAKWEDAYFDELAQVLSTLSHKTSRSSRNPLVWKVVEIVATSNIDLRDVHSIPCHSSKRICSMLVFSMPRQQQ